MPSNLPNILFINKKIPHILSCRGGSEVSMGILLNTLYRKGYPVEVIGTATDTGGLPNMYQSLEDVFIECRKRKMKIVDYIPKIKIGILEPFPITIYGHYDSEKILRSFVKTNPLTVVLTQLNASEEILKYTIPYKIPTILFIREPNRKEDALCLKQIQNPLPTLHIVFNSYFTANTPKFSKLNHLVQTSILYPSIEDHLFFSEYKTGKKYITLVNPIKIKGGELFFKLAKLFPSEHFLGVEGWYNPMLDGLNFSKIPNLIFKSRQDDIRTVLEVTKLLLIPSQWQESFGRIGVEALAAKVPVLASKCGGLPEVLGSSAFFVRSYHSINAWQKHLSVLLSNEKLLTSRVDQGIKQANKFKTITSVLKLIHVIQKLTLSR